MKPAMPEGFRIATAYVSVSPDTDGFKDELRAKLDEATSGANATAKVDLDLSQFDAKVSEALAKLDQFDGKTVTASLVAESAGLDSELEDANARLDEFDNRSASARLDLEDADFRAGMDAADGELDEMDARWARPKLGLDDDEFKTKLAEDKAELDAAGGDSANSSLGGGGSSGGGLFAALGTGLSTLIPGLGGATAGLGLLGGTGALAFGGIAQALTAAHQATTSTAQKSGQQAASMAATSFTNSVQVQSAQQAIGQAHQQAAQDAITSAASIESAETNLASVERSASQQQVQALQAVGQAQQQVEEANNGLTQAQYNLSQAWYAAREQIIQLNDQLADSKLAVQAAELAVQQAEQNQALVNQNAFTTALQRQQADLGVAQAKQQLKDATDKEADSAHQTDQANKAGVAGSQQVKQAKQAVTQASYAQTDANQALQNAQRNVTATEVNSAAQIAAAQRSLSSAREQAAYTQQKDAQSVASAEQNLTNTLKEQKLQAAETAASNNQASNQFAADMAKLTPAGRKFVDQVLSMRGELTKLEGDAQNAVLPGATTMLSGFQKLMPTIESGVSRMGGAIGNAFSKIGDKEKTPEAEHVLDGLINNGIKFANIVLPAFGKFAGELAKVGSQKGAADGIGNLLAGIVRGFTGLTKSLGKYEPQINSFLTAVGNILSAIGPPLGTIIGQVAKALGPLTGYLDKHPNGTVVKVLGDIAAGLITVKGLGSILPDFLTGPLSKFGKKGGDLLLAPFKSAGSKIGGLIKSGTSSAASAVGSFVADYAVKMAQAGKATGVWIAEHAAATATFIAENVAQAASATVAFIAENAATLGIAAGIVALVGVIIYLATHWSQVMGDIKNWSLDLWHNVLDPMWKGIEAGALWLYDNGIKPLWSQINTAFHGIESVASWLWHDVFDPMWHALESGASATVSALGKTWSQLEGVFKAPINFLIGTVYDDGIMKLWNDVVGHVGLGKLKLPKISKLADGGVIPGYAPGRDVVPAMLSPGEGVLTPGATRAIGHDTVHALNAAYPSGATSDATHFGGGGVLGDIGGALSDVGHAIVGGAKFAAQLASDPAKAVTGLLDKVIGTTATGDLGEVMTAIPKTLVSDLAKAIGSAVSSGQGSLPTGSSKAVGDLPAHYQTIASYLVSHGFTKYAAAGVAGNIDAESGGDPEILEIGGGGGGGLIQWTPYPAGYITGNVAHDLATQLHAILSWGGGPSMVNRATSPSNAAQIYQDYYERPASLTQTIGRRMASANAVYKGMGWGKFDDGGWLPPKGVGVNELSRPEAVLDPDESHAFIQLAQAASRGGDGAAAVPGAAPQVNFNYYGTQQPTVEQRAMQMRDLALALSGG